VLVQFGEERAPELAFIIRTDGHGFTAELTGGTFRFFWADMIRNLTRKEG
jgi:hypothetical protein